MSKTPTTCSLCGQPIIGHRIVVEYEGSGPDKPVSAVCYKCASEALRFPVQQLIKYMLRRAK